MVDFEDLARATIAERERDALRTVREGQVATTLRAKEPPGQPFAGAGAGARPVPLRRPWWRLIRS